jgi:hypothetical protein
MASRGLRGESKQSKDEPTTPAATTPQTVSTHRLNPEEIAARSYELWQERGYPIGSPEIDWFRAEEELRNRYSRTQKSA